ncbi:aspartate aminotransferase family protein [Rickettsiella endosymbiont of Litargus connexus]|jgi:acetylornithine aminotransferase|uniref:aspartate aminotransferase family protein n=1 Tax=Rickettsiella endosymbiont of Litargus connexus TaxID=3066237 RepID=UPI0027FFA6AD|nr:aspartate aminotransferase family protein [Gammaproteobacteria bacterium]MCH9754470.1 aspartate aminotransferase family protein [Gammaproteobacteria bacterium]MDD5161349.1 aspartate aminotransferase family protein [Candidatus Rickettsiella isopodorum]MDQ5899906.1 acetylornithine/N-succinyldiaminopimelate aminotransferase [Pseudomonadota bacterium]
MSSALMPIYPNRLPIAFEKGSGIWLTDTQGVRYLDALAGIAVCGLGHAHPAITETLCNQAAKLIHTSNTYHIPEQEILASELARVSGMDQVFFSNSGAESNEAAIKMTRLYARKKGIEQPIILAMKNAFHGRTMATLSLSGSERLQIGFEPLLERFIHIPFNDVAALENTIKQHKKNIIAIMLEPIQGDGGITAATPRFLQAIRNYCDQYDWLMILDEIQTGLCRTGPWFAYQSYHIFPDIVTIAKTLGNGFPIGAYCSRGKANNIFPIGKHGSTFAGSALACAVAITVIKTLEKENMSAHVKKMGSYLIKKLQHCFAKHLHVVAIKGQGLMIGIELDIECRNIPRIGLKHRLLFNVVSNNTIRLLPALILQETDADEICQRLVKTIDEFYHSSTKL